MDQKTARRECGFVTISPGAPSNRLVSLYHSFGGRERLGRWLPFGNTGPALMVCCPLDDPSEPPEPNRLIVPFRVLPGDYHALQPYWIEGGQGVGKADMDAAPNPDLSDLTDGEILQSFLENNLLSEEERELFPAAWTADLAVPDGLPKALQALLIALRSGLPPIDLRAISPVSGKTLIRPVIKDRYPSVHFSTDSHADYIAIADPKYQYAVENDIAAAGNSQREMVFMVAPEEQINVLVEVQKMDGGGGGTALASPSAGRLRVRADDTPDLIIPESAVLLSEKQRGIDAQDILMKTLAKAATVNASDIHFEPLGETGRVRVRVDGKLVPLVDPKDLQQGLFRRLSGVARDRAGISTTDTYRPDGGGFSFSFARTFYRVRASYMPQQGGIGKVVYRLQRQSASLESLEYLEFSDQSRQAIDAAIHAPQGLILITGPTGSGKSTTLYAALAELNRTDTNIQTIEDPIEKQIMGISQSAVDPQRQATFSGLLREILRQDPDVILVGEMRDDETIATSMEAAMTGHLVLSTLHTNNAAEAADRLALRATDPYLLAQCLTLLQAQRLVRRLCPHCKREARASEGDLAAMRSFGIDAVGPRNFWYPSSRGCDRCLKGFRGRRVVSEAILVDDEIRQIITAGNTADGTISRRIQQKCHRDGIRSYFQDALSYALTGETSVDEALSVANASQRVEFERQRNLAI